MIPALRQQFNSDFTPEKYQAFLKLMEERCGTPVKFQVSETPCFFPSPCWTRCPQYGKELIQQLGGLEYRKASFDAITARFQCPP